MTHKQKIKTVRDLIKKYKDVMLLSEWDIISNVSTEEYSNEGCVGICAPNPRYTFATITIYQSSFKKPNDLEEIVVHELAHCLTENLFRCCTDLLRGKFRTHHDIEDHRELLTERIAKIVFQGWRNNV